MAFRVHLHNERLGSLVIKEHDPVGINDIIQITKRSDRHEGVMYEVTLDLEFLKEARAFVKRGYETDGGVDCIMNVTLYSWNPNRRRNEHYATGQINFNSYRLTEDRVIINIEQTGIERKILNFMDTDVNLEALVSEDGSKMPAITLPKVVYHSKTVIKQSHIGPGSDEEFHIGSLPAEFQDQGDTISSSSVQYVQIDTTNQTFAELATPANLSPQATEFAQQNFGGVDLFWPNRSATTAEYDDFLRAPSRIAQRAQVFESAETGIMQIDIQLTARAKMVTSQGGGGDVDVDGSSWEIGKLEVIAWYEKRNQANQIMLIKELGRWNVGGAQDGGNGLHYRETGYETKTYKVENENAQVGDKHFVFLTYRVYGRYERPSRSGSPGTVNHDWFIQFDSKRTWVKFSSATFFEETGHQTCLIFEAVRRCVQFYTNIEDCFYSDLLGRTDLGYLVDGEASLIGITSGNKLRNNNQKPILITLDAILEFLNARYCIGFGFEMINNRWMFRVEKRAHFYNKGLKMVSLGPVYNIEKKVDNKMYWNQVEYGYQGKLDIGQTNGMDEFNTIRRAIIPVANSKNKLTISTKMRASGQQIEYQRRLQNTTIDSNLDDENFVLSLLRDGTGFKTKRNEGYEQVNGVAFPETQYNLDFRPAEMLRAWKEYIGIALIRSTDKTVKFSYGEVNYRMSAKKTGGALIKEDDNLNMNGVEPIIDPEIYEFTTKMTRDQAKIIKANKYGVVEFFDRLGNIYEGFISPEGIEHDEVNGIGTFKLWRVNRRKLTGSFLENLDDLHIVPFDRLNFVKGMNKFQLPNKVILSLRDKIFNFLNP